MAHVSESPRELFLESCGRIADSLAPLGFKYAKSGPHTQRKHGEFSYRVSFQSSRYNTAGEYVALWIHANVFSKRLAAWRAAQAWTLHSGDYVAGGQIGNLVVPNRWRDWNLAEGIGTTTEAISAVQEVALPYFKRFEDVPGLCGLLQREEIPGLYIGPAIEFLLCFADRDEAHAALSNFFKRRPELLPEYHIHLREFRENGMPMPRRTGFAYELAFATVAYDLEAPNAA